MKIFACYDYFVFIIIIIYLLLVPEISLPFVRGCLEFHLHCATITIFRYILSIIFILYLNEICFYLLFVYNNHKFIVILYMCSISKYNNFNKPNVCHDITIQFSYFKNNNIYKIYMYMEEGSAMVE